MNKIFSIAAVTFKEAVRDKILYNLIIFALLLILFSILLGDWSVFAREKVIKDFSLGVMSVSGLLVSVFIGVGMIQKEIQKRTVYSLLAKPVSRSLFILGKYLGLLLVLGFNLAMMTLCFYAVLWYTGTSAPAAMLKAIYLLFIEMGVIVAAAVLFSSFSTPFLSGLFTLGLYVAGHLSNDILNHIEFMVRHGERIPGAVRLSDFTIFLVRCVYHIVPNLEDFNIKGRVVYNLVLPPGYLFNTTCYGLTYIGLFLLISCLWFSRRDFV